MNAAARRAIRARAVAKGDPLQTARLAGIHGGQAHVGVDSRCAIRCP